MDVPLEVAVERHDGTTVLTVSGELDMMTAPKLRECLAGTDGTVVVDLLSVSFLDSSGIAALVDARKRLTDTGGNLLLRKPEGIVRRALEIIGLAGWIED